MFSFITHSSIVQDLYIVKRSIQNIETKRQMKMLVYQLEKYSENQNVKQRHDANSKIVRNRHTQTHVKQYTDQISQTIDNEKKCDDYDNDYEYLE